MFNFKNTRIYKLFLSTLESNISLALLVISLIFYILFIYVPFIDIPVISALYGIFMLAGTLFGPVLMIPAGFILFLLATIGLVREIKNTKDFNKIFSYIFTMVLSSTLFVLAWNFFGSVTQNFH